MTWGRATRLPFFAGMTEGGEGNGVGEGGEVTVFRGNDGGARGMTEVGGSGMIRV